MVALVGLLGCACCCILPDILIAGLSRTLLNRLTKNQPDRLENSFLKKGPVVERSGLYFLGQNELAMKPGERITIHNAVGTLSITALDGLTRAYTWEGATRLAVLFPRDERWYGSLGIYNPGAGDMWEEHNGITRPVVEEGQQHFDSVAQALQYANGQGGGSGVYVYRDDGLMVGWSKEPDRRQLNVEVWQLVVDGAKPTKLPGSADNEITVEQNVNPPSN